MGVVERRTVSEAFLQFEADKGDQCAAELISSGLSDDKFFNLYRKYADTCKVEGRLRPVLVWTVGVLGDERFQFVQKWCLTKVRLYELYSCAIGQHMLNDLNSVQGNLQDFAALVKNSPSSFPEFNLSCLPTDERKQTVLGVKHLVNNRRGCIELIDGAHRTVSMLASGMTETHAYIGII